ncbi:MAG TPA: ABC transporter ATP-binding protein [Candidatus Limnocylindria bacterium]|nr:ABC transporter ATP-binding protein [Candidatus Limnocylindria bacterium]
MTTLRAEGVSKRYPTARGGVDALRSVSLGIASGESVAIVGPSGCGKSTLLGLIAALEPPTRGSIVVDDLDLAGLDEAARARYRREAVGLVFQSTNLLPFLTAVENVDVALALRTQSDPAAARALLETLELAEHADRLPDQLSGGQRQRVGIARAVVHRPRLILADEPTGELDTTSSARTMDLLRRVQRELGATLIVVTHDEGIARSLDRLVYLRDGRVVGDTASTRATGV